MSSVLSYRAGFGGVACARDQSNSLRQTMDGKHFKRTLHQPCIIIHEISNINVHTVGTGWITSNIVATTSDHASKPYKNSVGSGCH